MFELHEAEKCNRAKVHSLARWIAVSGNRTAIACVAIEVHDHYTTSKASNILHPLNNTTINIRYQSTHIINHLLIVSDSTEQLPNVTARQIHLTSYAHYWRIRLAHPNLWRWTTLVQSFATQLPPFPATLFSLGQGGERATAVGYQRESTISIFTDSFVKCCGRTPSWKFKRRWRRWTVK